MHPIYLDYNATTPVDTAVREEMSPYFVERYGNPGSGHALGREAAAALERARENVARLVGCRAFEVYFTGCATEANNLVVKGAAEALAPRGRHIVISAVEHPSVRAPAMWLRENGFQVTELRVDGGGLVDPDDLAECVRGDTILVSVMHANNETGAVMPVAELAAVCRKRGVLFHTDCSQSAGKIPVDVAAWGADLATFAGHKVYAPKGVGVLVRRGDAPLAPILHGGGQERGLRSGTENVAFAVGIGEAFRVARLMLDEESARQRALRDALESALVAKGGILNGHPEPRLPNTINISFPGLVGQEILDGAPEVMASTGAACHGREVALSPVLSAMGIGKHCGMGAIRISLGRGTTQDDVARAAEALAKSVRRLRR